MTVWCGRPQSPEGESTGRRGDGHEGCVCPPAPARPRRARARQILKQGLRCSGACRLGHGVGRAAFAPTSFHGAFRNFSSQWAPLDRTVGWFSIYREQQRQRASVVARGKKRNTHLI